MAATTSLHRPAPSYLYNNAINSTNTQLHCNFIAGLISNYDVRSRVSSRQRLRKHTRGLLDSSIRYGGCRWPISGTNAELRAVVESSSSNISSNVRFPAVSLAEIPVTCYQILGVSSQAEKDEIVKSVMHLRNTQIEEGYTAEVVVSRQDLLMDVRDKLLFEPEYAVNIKDKVPPKSSLQIPWAWLPGALCLLQEAGEENIVLDIGRRALQHPDAKPYMHDILLAMTLAECAIAESGFDNNKISQGFEALARAQCLLRSKVSLGKMTLLSQIEESLEELAPACTLELLGMPHAPENDERRLGAIAALRELLRQGLDVEASCQVHDWPVFLNQALYKLIASEIVELLQWDELALTRKNRKSLESQNQRVVIDFDSFYMVFIAHIALGFSSKQLHLINKGKVICDSLNASEGVDLKFEESFCLYLLGQVDESTITEKLSQLEVDRNTASRISISGKESNDISYSKKSLEKWLKDNVLSAFADTRDCSPSLDHFFAAGKQNSTSSRQAGKTPNLMFNKSQQLLHPSFSSNGAAPNDTSQHLGPAVKQLTPPNLRRSFVEGKDNGDVNSSDSSVQLKRKLSLHQNKVWFEMDYVFRKLLYFTSLGCIMYAGFKMMNSRFILTWKFKKPVMSSSSSLDKDIISENVISKKIRKLFSESNCQPKQPTETVHVHSHDLSGGFSSSVKGAHRHEMPIEEAEALVKRWQGVKSDALGPDHHMNGLIDILDESMLSQWISLADAAKTRSCFWKFVLLQLSILRAEILVDDGGKVMAEIEAILEEAAELVDETHLKNPNYYSIYKILYVLKRQNDGSWRFCEGDIHTPS